MSNRVRRASCLNRLTSFEKPFSIEYSVRMRLREERETWKYYIVIDKSFQKKFSELAAVDKVNGRSMSS